MSKKFFTSLFIFMLFCSPALADPYLWSAHNTIVNMDNTDDGTLVTTQLDTARFFSITLEAADSDDAMPELNVNLNDRTTIPKFTINGGNYTYWNGDGLKTINGTTESFDIARSDTVMYYYDEANHNNHSTLIGSDNFGYAPTNDGGDWIHFFDEAETGLAGVNVSWEAQDTSKAGSGTVPTFKTTQEQLDDIVPYIEYFYDTNDLEAEGRHIAGFNWRFVHSNDVDKAVSIDKDITISLRYTGGDMEWWDTPDTQFLGENLKNGLDPVTIKSGDILEGTVELKGTDQYSVIYQTILRYYFDDKKNECYQWRFVTGVGTVVNLTSSYMIEVPLIAGQPNYDYTKYYRTDFGLYVWGTPLESKYYKIGKLTIDGGNYEISDQNNVLLDSNDFAEIPLVPMLMPGASNPQYMPMMEENFRPVGWNYLGERYYARWIHLADETGNSLSGKTITWTFPDDARVLNGNATMPEFKSVSEMLSPDGYFPYIEIVSEDDKITAIKYRFVQSPDLEGSYTPEDFCLFRIGISGAQNEAGDPVDLWLAGNYIDDGTKAVYESDELTLEEPVIPVEGFSISVEVDVYPVKNTWEDWVTWVNNGGDNNNGCVKYSWIFSSNAPISQMALIDEDDEILDNIAETLSDDSDVFAVQREEVSNESDVTDNVKEIISNDNAELEGRFNQLNITQSGTYAVNVILPDELYDEIEGAGSADLVVYPITDSDIDEPVVTSMFIAAASDTKPVSGQLLASDGTAFDTVDTKNFILTSNLKNAAGENYTNYSLYLGLKTSTTPEEPETPTDKTEEKPETTETPGSTETPTEKEESEKKPETTDKPEESKPADSEKTPGSTETPTSKAENDEAQNIDAVTAEKIVKIISSDEYEIKTFEEALNDSMFTKYDYNVKQNTRILDTISKDFENATVSGVLPSFTLSVEKPVMLIMKFSVDSVNNLPLHFFKEKGAEVAGASLRFVKFASNPETGEDKDAIFTDGTKKITTLSANTVYVAALFDSGSYAPIVVTGNAKSDSSTGSTTGSSGSGCNTSLLGLGALILLAVSFKRK